MGFVYGVYRVGYGGGDCRGFSCVMSDRWFRNLVCFLFGVVLAAHGVVAFAETVAATAQESPPQVYAWEVGNAPYYFSDPQAACNWIATQYPESYGPFTSQIQTPGSSTSGGGYQTCLAQGPSRPYAGWGAGVGQGPTCGGTNGEAKVYQSGGVCPTRYSCPVEGGWTLSGQSCTRPDCVAPETRQPDGTCGAPCSGALQTRGNAGSCACDAAQLNSVYWGRPWVSGTGSMPLSVCDGGCARNTGFGLGGGGKYTVEVAEFTGATCSGDTRPTEKDPIPNHSPKCQPSEGVMTSSSGTVACVPEGTPDARVPQVQTTKKTETFADNSTRTTETTKTTDPATSVTDIRSTIVSTGGQSGSAGTTSIVESSGTNTSGTGTGSDGGDGTCDPKSDFCGGPDSGGLYAKKTKTVSSVLGTFKDGVMSSGIGSAATGFFTVSVPGGACPSWVVNVAYLNSSVDLSQYFCTATALSMMNLVGAVLLFVAGFVGFRWAIL